jgi:ankyrin repeat protein
VRELLNHGAGIESANNDGWTPLKSAANKSLMEVVRELPNHGASVHNISKNSYSPLKSVYE